MTKTIVDLIDLINSDLELEMVPVIPEVYCKYQYCFYNVLKKVETDGGCFYGGWTIEDEGLYFLAVRHAVWESSEGELIDITPSEHKTTIFIPDNFIFEKGKRYNSIKLSKNINLVCDDYFLVLDEQYDLISKHGKIEDIDQISIDNINFANYYNFLLNAEQALHKYLKSNNNAISKCFCSKGKNYRNCHHLLLHQEKNKFRGSISYKKDMPN